MNPYSIFFFLENMYILVPSNWKDPNIYQQVNR